MTHYDFETIINNGGCNSKKSTLPSATKTKYIKLKLVEYHAKEFKEEIETQRKQAILTQREAVWCNQLEDEERGNIENIMEA